MEAKLDFSRKKECCIEGGKNGKGKEKKNGICLRLGGACWSLNALWLMLTLYLAGPLARQTDGWKSFGDILIKEQKRRRNVPSGFADSRLPQCV